MENKIVEAKPSLDRTNVEVKIGDQTLMFVERNYDSSSEYNKAVGSAIVKAIESGAKAQGSMATKISNNIEQAKEAYGI